MTYNHYICDSGYSQVPHICYSSYKIWNKIESCQWGFWFPCLNPATDAVVRPLFYYKSAIVISFHKAYYYCITKKRARSYSSLTCDSLIVPRVNTCYIKDCRVLRLYLGTHWPNNMVSSQMIFNLEPMNQWVFSMNLVSSFKVTTASTGGFRNDESVYIWHPVEATVKRLHRLTFKLILFNRRLSVPSSVCLSFPLSIRSLVWPPVRFFIDPSVGLSVFLSIRTSVRPFNTPSVCRFVRPLVRPSVRQLLRRFVGSSVRFSITGCPFHAGSYQGKGRGEMAFAFLSQKWRTWIFC